MIMIFAVTENEKMKDCNTCRKFKKHAFCVKCEYEPKDLVDVVRCKDCKYFAPLNNDDHALCGDRAVYDDDFCSAGERRE